MPAGMKGLDSLWNTDLVTLRKYSLSRQPGNKVYRKPLPYSFDSLEPVIMEKDLKYHYETHH